MHPSIHRVALVLSPIGFAVAPRADGQIVESIYSLQISNGVNPYCGLLQASDGHLYGTASGGGAQAGAVFKISSGGALSRVVSFAVTNGVSPVAELVEGRDGNFYGTTLKGGQFSLGTVFKLSPSGVITRLVSFSSTNGIEPTAPLVEGNDGAFYGTTSGGEDYDGTIFRITTNGVFTTLFVFAYTNGAIPLAGLTLGNDGHFYGTTYNGGPQDGHGTVFKTSATGVLTTLVTFRGINGTGGNPQAGLVLTRDGNFYGTTERGGVGAGTIFRMTPEGALTTITLFGTAIGVGGFPRAKLFQAGDGYLYGTTAGGGANGFGTVFRVTTNGTLTTLHSFNSRDGAYPESALIEARDGTLYGTTVSGGLNGRGTVFRVVPLSLSASRSGNQVVLSWPTNAAGFVLQSALDASAPLTWIDFTNPPSVNGALFKMTNAMSRSAQLFRLRKL